MYLIWVVHQGYMLLGHTTVSQFSPNSTHRHTTSIFLKRRMTVCNPFYYYCQNILNNITERFYFLSYFQKIQFKVLTARTRFRLRNAKSLRRRASAKTRRHGKSACLHAKNAHKVPCFRKLEKRHFIKGIKLFYKLALKFRVFKKHPSGCLNHYEANLFLILY